MCGDWYHFQGHFDVQGNTFFPIYHRNKICCRKTALPSLLRLQNCPPKLKLIHWTTSCGGKWTSFNVESVLRCYFPHLISWFLLAFLYFSSLSVSFIPLIPNWQVFFSLFTCCCGGGFGLSFRLQCQLHWSRGRFCLVCHWIGTSLLTHSLALRSTQWVLIVMNLWMDEKMNRFDFFFTISSYLELSLQDRKINLCVKTKNCGEMLSIEP